MLTRIPFGRSRWWFHPCQDDIHPDMQMVKAAGIDEDIDSESDSATWNPFWRIRGRKLI